MSLTLIVEENIQLRDFYDLNLLTWVGTEVHGKKNANFAIEFLQDQSPDLIITRTQISTEKTLEAIHTYLLDNNLDIPIISLGHSPPNDMTTIHLDSGLDVKALVQASAQKLGVTAQDMAKKVVPHFFPIPIQHFNNVDLAVCDIYADISGDDDPQIICEADQPVPQVAIKDMIAGGTPFLFVKKEDRLNFLNNYNQVVASKLELVDLNEDEKIQAVESSQFLLQERLAKVGITEETIELSQRNLRQMLETTKKTPSLMRLLKRLLKNKSGYLFKHSQILMFVSAHLMDHLDWGTEEQKEKLQFIAYFHDIALENDVQAQIHDTQALRQSSIPPKKKELVKKHAQLSAALVAQYPNAPMGAEQIIKQHHGTLNGLGFSEHYSQNVSPMAIVHILAEDFVDAIIHAGEKFDVKAKIAEMREQYTTQRFKKIIDILAEITFKSST